MSKKCLAVHDLRISFGREPHLFRAVNGVSFELWEGETLGIVGESGSGKTITALATMGLLPPAARLESGQVIFWNREGQPEDLHLMPPGLRRRFNGGQLSMVFQEPMSSLNPVFTCGEQVAETLRYHRGLSAAEATALTLHIFEKVRLAEPERIYRSYPHQLSGGQKQRVMIAMALSCEPRIIICDEPTTALDVSIQKGILELLNDLKKSSGASFVFISHDLGVIAKVADRVLVMYRGEVVESGTVSDLFSHPTHAYTRGLLACRPRLDVKQERLPVLSDFMPDDEIRPVETLPRAKLTFSAPVRRREGQEATMPGNDLLQKKPLLRVQDLHVSYPGSGRGWFRKGAPVRAVDGISFELFPGQILGVVGESGSGKTTLGRALVRLAPITAGEIFFRDRAVHALPDRELPSLHREVQMIFQDPYGSLNPRMSVGEALLEPMRTFKLFSTKAEMQQRVRELLDLVRLPADSMHRYPHEFSGGQRQRVGIARALAVEPSLLICDESVSSLDVSIQAQILNLLLDLRKELGLTFLFISHDLSVVKFFSDQLLVMKEGKIVDRGTPEVVYRSPQSDYTRQLIDAIPDFFLGERRGEKGN